MKNQVEYLELYLQLFPEYNKFGVKPCLISEAYWIKVAFDLSNKPSIKNIPLNDNDIKVSLPDD